jgi:hypothetical protein
MDKVENFIISSKIIYFISSLLIVILGLKYYKKRILLEDTLLILFLTIIVYAFLEYLVKLITDRKIQKKINETFIEGFTTQEEEEEEQEEEAKIHMEEEMHVEEKEFGKVVEEEEEEKPKKETKGLLDSLLDKLQRPSTEGHSFNADVPVSYINNDRTVQPININVSYNSTKYDNDGIDAKGKVYANGMSYSSGKLQAPSTEKFQFDDGMKKKNDVSEPVRVNEWETKPTPGSAPKEDGNMDLTKFFSNYLKQMNDTFLEKKYSQKNDENSSNPYLDFRNKSASPQDNVLKDEDDKNKKDGKQLFYSPNGDTILNPNLWKGAFFGTDRPNYCPEMTKDGSNTCPILLNNFWSEWKTYPQN